MGTARKFQGKWKQLKEIGEKISKIHNEMRKEGSENLNIEGGGRATNSNLCKSGWQQ